MNYFLVALLSNQLRFNSRTRVLQPFPLLKR
jgi:hypothetical protein